MGANGVEAVEAGALVSVGDEDYVVVPKGEGCTLGQWYCCTCLEFFANNLNKDFHIYRGKHVLGWICHEHGELEVP